ncbi:ribonucleotide reductase [Pueribacillus theae]|uniref:Ribonucleotide reductase n=1 Tax=Pueribacillus theae TaxID=2171751 RepID=A0A2U1JMJ9_9BACI|nr:ribonucleotide-diphosphate reductase subunit beta [Pueribacillus theae]PWA06396.1 ribonucleotide reductase [Pueribacillus theae]
MVNFEKIDRVDIESLHHDFNVDHLLDYIHDGLRKIDKNYPLDLYYKYEKQRWQIQELDFKQDKIDWNEKLTEGQRKAFLSIASGFHHGERQVAVDVIPMISAMPTDEHKVFLSSHLEDESRHTIFFDRFYREAVGIEAENMMETLDKSFDFMSETFIGAFGFLAYLVDQIRVNPDDKRLLVSALTNYQLWIEGVLALSVMKLTLSFCKNNNVLPGFHKGFLATTRDESRHVQFGMRLLKELIHNDSKLTTIVYDTVTTMLTLSSTFTQKVDYSMLGYERDMIRNVMMTNLKKKFNMIGLPIPEELQDKIRAIEPEAAAGG